MAAAQDTPGRTHGAGGRGLARAASAAPMGSLRGQHRQRRWWRSRVGWAASASAGCCGGGGADEGGNGSRGVVVTGAGGGGG